LPPVTMILTRRSSSVSGGYAVDLNEAAERHVRNQRADVVTSMTEFEFDADARIRQLTICLPQPR
jgi:hypothetical protein